MSIRKWLWICVALLGAAPAGAQAQAGCVNSVLTENVSFVSRVTRGVPIDAGVTLNTSTYTYTVECTSVSNSPDFQLVISSDLELRPYEGLTSVGVISSNAVLTYQDGSTGKCNVTGYTKSYYTGMATMYYAPTPAKGFGTCRFTFTFTSTAKTITDISATSVRPVTSFIYAPRVNPWLLNCASIFCATNTATKDSVTFYYFVVPYYVAFVSCTLSLQSTNLTVTLPTVGPSALRRAGETAGLTPFTLSLSSCSSGAGVYSLTANWSFPSSNGIAISNDGGTASNVGTQILRSDFTPVSDGGSETLTTVSPNGVITKSTITYFARYYALGAATPGTVRGVATFNLTYN